MTVDRKLQHQQNLSAFNIAVVVLVAQTNTLADLQPLMPSLLEQRPNANQDRRWWSAVEAKVD